MRDALFRLLYRVIRVSRPRRIDHGGPRTILVLQYAMPLGCCVHGTPIYAAIKQANPNTTIIVASRGTGLATLQHDPNIDHLIDTPDPMASFASLRKTIRTIRKHLRANGWQPDIVLQDASNRRGTYALFALLLRVAPTKGFADAPALYDNHLQYDPMLSLIDNNLRLVDGSRHVEPGVYFTADELEHARAMLREVNPAGLPVTAFVVQGSGGQPTEWHDDRFAAVIQHMQKRGRFPVFLGTADNAAKIERIRSMAGPPGCSLAGRTSIPQLAALLSLCDFMITIDTGTMHVGRAVDLPMIVLGPAWQDPMEWMPLSKINARVLRGFYLHEVPPHCRVEVSLQRVITSANEWLMIFQPPEHLREIRIAQRLSTTRP
ncbi:MAG TPA: glycosyltransferase family 9 protein [Acidobacteriaceae bacterium]